MSFLLFLNKFGLELELEFADSCERYKKFMSREKK